MAKLLGVELECLRAEEHKAACTLHPPEVGTDYTEPEGPSEGPSEAGLLVPEVEHSEAAELAAAANACSAGQLLHTRNSHKEPAVQLEVSPVCPAETVACHSMPLPDFATEDCKVVVRAGVAHPAAASSPSNQAELMVEEEVLEAAAVADAGRLEEARKDSCASLTLATMSTSKAHRAKILLDVARQRRTTRMAPAWPRPYISVFGPLTLLARNFSESSNFFLVGSSRFNLRSFASTPITTLIQSLSEIL